jgi:two-component system, OmpR family, phosphate regulon response regulator OmpR
MVVCAAIALMNGTCCIVTVTIQPQTMMTTALATKILVLDDDARLRDLLRRYLGEQGFAVQVADSAARLRDLLARERFDLIVLDVMMPQEDGLSVLKRLRSSGDTTPVLMLTAQAEVNDRITGLELGADDYLAKPFSPPELVARIQAVLRRAPTPDAPGAPTAEEESVQFGDFTLDLARRTLHKHGQLCAMTAGEFGVLKILAKNPQKTLSRDRLMELARGRELSAFDRSLDVQISRIRKLLGQDDAAKPQYVQTVRGVGYVFLVNP